jgi:hypothetical protein
MWWRTALWCAHEWKLALGTPPPPLSHDSQLTVKVIYNHPISYHCEKQSVVPVILFGPQVAVFCSSGRGFVFTRNITQIFHVQYHLFYFTVLLNIAVSWVVAPCSLVEVYRRFRGACCRHHKANVNFYQTARRYNPEDSHIHTRRRENLKSYCTIVRSSVFLTNGVGLPLYHIIIYVKKTILNSQYTSLSNYGVVDRNKFFTWDWLSFGTFPVSGLVSSVSHGSFAISGCLMHYRTQISDGYDLVQTHGCPVVQFI